MTLIGGLEKILGEERTQQLTQSRLYRGAVDGIANNVFSQVYILNEYFIAGLTFQQALMTRATAFLGNMITGGPYGWWEDKFLQYFKIEEEGPLKSHWLKRYGASVAAFATGQSWIYALYLAAPVMGKEIYEGISHLDLDQINHCHRAVDWQKVGKSAFFLTVAAPALGAPQRWIYKTVRKQLGVLYTAKTESKNI